VWGDNTTNGTSSGTVSGTGDQLVTTSHTFAAAGTYIVTLTVTDGWGRPTSVTKSVTVTG
jgi:PKD repeat protein